MEIRGAGTDDFMSESVVGVGLGTLMDLEEDRVRPKRYR
jgi:hypothetical protein